MFTGANGPSTCPTAYIHNAVYFLYVENKTKKGKKTPRRTVVEAEIVEDHEAPVALLELEVEMACHVLVHLPIDADDI